MLLLSWDQKLSDKINFFARHAFHSNWWCVEMKAPGLLVDLFYQRLTFFAPIATQDVLGELNDSKNSQIGFYTDILQDIYNPVARIKDYTPKRRTRSLVANSSLSWEILNGLTAKTELGLTANWSRNNTWSGAIYNNYFDTSGNKTFGGNATIRASEGWNLRWVNTL